MYTKESALPAKWQHYLNRKKAENHSVTGNVQVTKAVYSPQLNNQRDILVYLPPSYYHARARRYPVIYMHDGQNLFDNATSYAGEWGVDETMENLSGEGFPAIIVGIPNTGETRINEYNPFHNPRFGQGRGDQYLSFIMDTLKPMIDEQFRTQPGRLHTGIMGSSMGGLISLYAFFKYPHIFGLAGAMSPALWVTGGKMSEFVRNSTFANGKIYLDAGTEESGRKNAQGQSAFLLGVRSMNELLKQKGYIQGKNLLYVEDQGGRHSEQDWARRLPDALRFLLKNR